MAVNNLATINGANLFYGGSNTGSVQAGYNANHVAAATAFPLPDFTTTFQTPLSDLSNALVALPADQTLTGSALTNAFINASAAHMLNGRTI